MPTYGLWSRSRRPAGNDSHSCLRGCTRLSGNRRSCDALLHIKKIPRTGRFAGGPNREPPRRCQLRRMRPQRLPCLCLQMRRTRQPRGPALPWLSGRDSGQNSRNSWLRIICGKPLGSRVALQRQLQQPHAALQLRRRRQLRGSRRHRCGNQRMQLWLPRVRRLCECVPVRRHSHRRIRVAGNRSQHMHRLRQMHDRMPAQPSGTASRSRLRHGVGGMRQPRPWRHRAQNLCRSVHWLRQVP